MGSLIITLLIVGVTLTALFWGGTVFLHGYWYTEASTAIYWQAPAAAGAVTLFYFLWCLLNANAEGATSTDVPYNTIFAFSNKVTKHKKPVERFVAITKSGERVRYKRQTTYSPVTGTQHQYLLERADGSLDKRYTGSGVVAIEAQEGAQQVRYELAKGEENRRFVSEDGWVIEEDVGGIDGNPTATSSGLLFMNWSLNLAHFGVWFACLWLILRFQLSHALGLAFLFWLVTTVLLLPLLLGQAGGAAQASSRAAAPPARSCPSFSDC